MTSRLIISTSDLRAQTSVTDLRAAIASTLLSAEYVLDPDTINQWLEDQLALAESTALAFSKAADPDAFTFSDAPAASLGLAKSDSFSFADAPLVAVTFNRSFSDAFSLDDFTAVDAVIKDMANTKVNVFGFSDDQAFGVGKGLADSVSLTEDHAVSFSKATTDSFSVSEVLSRAVTYNRAFSDSQGFGDAVDSHAIAKDLSDTQTMTEAHAASTSLGKTDSYSLADAPAQSFDKAAADSVSLSESLSRTVTYNRTFTDAFSMDDAATVNALIKDHANAKTNVFSFADSQAFGFSKAATDTFSFVDAFDSVEVGKGVSDSVSMTENFSFALFSNAAMNAAALNVSPFNE